MSDQPPGPSPWPKPEPFSPWARPSSEPEPPGIPGEAAPGTPDRAAPETPAQTGPETPGDGTDDRVGRPPAVASTATPSPSAPSRPLLPGWAWLALGLVLVLVCGVFPFVLQTALSGATSTQSAEVPAATPAPVPTLTGSPFVSVAPEHPPAKLRDVKPVSIVGPTWDAGEKTFTFAFRGVPFAFRGGAHWGCMRGTWENGDGKEIDAVAWRCIDEQKGSKAATVDLLVRRCAQDCSAAEQAKLDTDWLDAPVTYQRKDATTRYAEGAKGTAYTLVVSHYFPERPGDPLGWQVGVSATCLPIHKATCQKVVNDIRTQSG
ncbi:MAG: hypothetical protein ACRDT6_03265 [Micromonosporaceae bacterium]